MRNKTLINSMISVCSGEVTKYNKIRSGIIKGSIDVSEKVPNYPAYWIEWCNKIILQNQKQIILFKDKLIGLK